MGTARSVQMQANQINASCKQLVCLHCVIVCVCLLQLTFCPSRYPELPHIIRVPHHYCLCFNFQNTLIFMLSLNLRASLGGGQCRDFWCPFSKKETWGSEAEEEALISILFSSTLCTSPGCLSCNPWDFVEDTKRRYLLVNPSEKWVLKYIHLRIKKNFWMLTWFWLIVFWR